MTATGCEDDGETPGLTQAQFQRRYLYRSPQIKGKETTAIDTTAAGYANAACIGMVFAKDIE